MTIDQEFFDVLSGITNYVQNERVRAYNEGVDAERARCAAIADEHAKSECTGQESQTAAMRLGAQSIAGAIRAAR